MNNHAQNFNNDSLQRRDYDHRTNQALSSFKKKITTYLY
jgi:hypothetical protein